MWHGLGVGGRGRTGFVLAVQQHGQLCPERAVGDKRRHGEEMERGDGVKVAGEGLLAGLVPEHLLGNLGDTTLATLLASEKQRRFGNAKFDTLPKYCLECPVLFACYGECPRNRFIKTPDGEDGLNYLCAGYRAFFTHIDAPMKAMASLLRQGRYADEIMQETCPA